MSRIGVAVIGAGMIGRAHAAGYRAASTVFGKGLPPVDLVTISDLNKDFANDVAGRFGFEKVESDWKTILNDDRIHVVSVAVANSLHRELSEQLLAAGKHVLCEKPLAPSTSDAKAMVEAAKKAKGVHAATGFAYRRSPAIAAIKKEIENGNLGKPYLFSGRYWCDYSVDASGPMSWRYKGGPGSGALADIGSHLIDLSEFMFGPIKSILGGTFATYFKERALPLGVAMGHDAAELSDKYEPVENEDLATFIAKFENGAVGTISASRATHGYSNGLAFDVQAEKGAASFDLSRMGEFSYFDSNTPNQTSGTRRVLVSTDHPYIDGGLAMSFPMVGFGTNDQFVWQARAFLEQVAGMHELPPVATFEEGLRNLVILDAVSESAASGGKEININ
jgi:predicted dehydrogenase